MAVGFRVAVATLLMLVAAAIAYMLSSGHVFFFPFLLILGAPLALAFRRPPPRPPLPPSLK
ncbi:MAG: hypothetical protein JO263_02110 [Candidatus Eremiobacteraeota bacterium]|nr:hypothetical protein [Candidatus Eremiobacteraeota bacterium]